MFGFPENDRPSFYFENSISRVLFVMNVKSMRRLSGLAIGLSFALFLLSGCGEDRAEWNRVDKEQLTEQQKKQLKTGQNAWKKLGKTLLQRVREVKSSEGPAAAIRVCRDEADEITKRIAGTTGVRMGRTSHRLRNPDNTPPKWADHLPEKRPEQPEVFRRTDSRIGITQPIRLSKECATCHGPEEQIPDAVQKELNASYPQDEATGFQPGDLRGWFWVEVPDQTRSPSSG